MKLEELLLEKLLPGDDPTDPGSYLDELSRQCRPLVFPLAVILFFAWLPYIPLDMTLFRDMRAMVLLRWGMTASAGLVLAAYLFPTLRKNSYFYMLLMVGYSELAAGVIVGLTAGNAAYMGGLSLLLILIAIVPFKKTHGLLILAGCCLAFIGAGIYAGMSFKTAFELYGLFNFIAAVIMTVTAIFLLGAIRKRNYINHKAIHAAHRDLQSITQKMVVKNDELERAYSDLAITNDELRSANKARRDLLGMAAHDLKDPLQVISLYTETLKTELDADKTALKKLDRISRSADKMINLIQEILETATIDSGKLTLNQTVVDMGKLVETAAKTNRPNLEKKGQELFLSLQPGALVMGDKRRLEQVLDNLISNAVKFSPTGAAIHVTVKRGEGERAGRILTSVRDHGPGLSEDDKRNLFRKFQRLSARPTAGESTTGLGLYIARSLVKLHGGDITVGGEKGKGAVFTIELPEKKEEHAAPQLSGPFSNELYC